MPASEEPREGKALARGSVIWAESVMTLPTNNYAKWRAPEASGLFIPCPSTID